MAPVYADHPFPLITTPVSQLKEGEKPDIYCEAASEMALVHNMMVRGLNSIYLQAPHITPKDEYAFCQYTLMWHKLLHTHHTGEETDFFPHIEELSGEKGLMAGNVEQHHAFHDGLEALVEYVRAVSAKKEKYDGAKITKMIDDFGKALTTHLADEIPTIDGLRKYADKLESLPKLMQAEAEKNMSALGLTTGLVWAFVNLDLHYEDDRWLAWPPAPAPVKFICRYITYWFHTDWWKFSSVDRTGTMKPLYAVPGNKSL